MAAALSHSLAFSRNLSFDSSSSGSPLKQIDQTIGSLAPTKLSFGRRNARTISKRELIVQASNSDGGRLGGGSIFVGGFVLGGLVVGTLGCVYAPQISKVLVGPERKELMKKLPKFIYDEEKVVEKKRQQLMQKIEELNAAIEKISNDMKWDRYPISDASPIYTDGTAYFDENVM